MFQCKCPSRQDASGANDLVTLQDCKDCDYRPRPGTVKKRLLLKNHMSPGDVLVMSAAIRSLHVQNPGEYEVAVDTTCPALFEHSPDVVPATGEFETLEMHYPLVHHSSTRGCHFMQAYCEYLEDRLGVRVPLLVNRPQVWLSRAEKAWMGQVQEATNRPTPFWLLNAGWKDCYPTKSWGASQYQQVVDILRGKVLFVQVGKSDAGHHHPALRGVLSLVGQTDDRQLVRLAWHARGALCGLTFLHHLMAALEKPCVTIAGGREPVQWNSYPKCTLFHTVGALDCCRNEPCWKSKFKKEKEGDSVCEYPVYGEEVGRCMALIHPEEVAKAILRYEP